MNNTQQIGTPPKLLTTRELAECLGLAPDTVRRWARTGRIPAIRVNARTIRFVLEEVENALRAGCPVEGEVPRG